MLLKLNSCVELWARVKDKDISGTPRKRTLIYQTVTFSHINSRKNYILEKLCCNSEDFVQQMAGVYKRGV